MVSLFVRIALLALSLVPSQSLVGLQPTSFQDHPPLERFQLVDPLLSSRVFSAGTWTKWNSSDDPRKESVSKQGCYLKKKYYSSILITRCLAIWTFQCLHLVLTPPYHLPLVTFAFFSEMAGFMFLLSGGPPPDLSGPPPSGEFPPSGENSFPFHNFTEEPRWVSSQSSRH